MYFLQVVSYGKNTCVDDDWVRIYQGYAMAPHRNGRRTDSSQPICVEVEPEPTGLIVYPGDVTNSRSPDYSFLRSTATVFDSPNRLVPCAVCARN